jgi:hypothetical protein
MTDYSVYLSTATPDQADAIRAVIACGTQKKAAKMLGINKRSLERRLASAKSAITGAKMPSAGRTHCFIPDAQVTPDTPNDHLAWAGKYIAEEKPDVVINIGDFADMESLSSYDFGKKAAEGKRILKDFDAANKAMNILMKPIHDEPGYNPELHLTLGNHEHRINRAVDSDAKLDGLLSIDSLNYKEHGWAVHEFLTPVCVDGVWYCHFFANAMSGKPIGGANITTRLNTIGFSFSMGHQQCHMQGIKNLSNGRVLRGLVSGAFYMHDEDYKGVQGNTHFRGLTIKREVVDGNYDIMEVSMDYLCRRYEGVPLHQFTKEKYPDIFARSLFLQRQALKYD